MLKRKVVLFTVVSLAALCLSAVPARADMFGFMPITHNTNGAVAAQFSLGVSAGGGSASFTFYNNLAPGPVVSGPLASSITKAFFDNRTAPTLLTDLTLISQPSGVDFVKRVTGTLPGWNNLLDGFTFSFGAKADSTGGVKNNGVQPGEYVTLTFSTPPAVTLADMVAALNAGAGDVPDATGTLRVGIHVQGIGSTCQSDSFVLTPVPLPGAFLLGMLGLGAAGWRLRKSA